MSPQQTALAAVAAAGTLSVEQPLLLSQTGEQLALFSRTLNSPCCFQVLSGQPLLSPPMVWILMA
jgi:hypothetical protein